MIEIKNWNYKSQKKSYEKHKHEINDIYEMYYKTIDYYGPQINNGEVILSNKKTTKYAYSIENIANKFGLAGTHEILFLIAQHPESRKVKCEFCDEGSTYFNRAGNKINSCGHERFCAWHECKNPLGLHDGYFCSEHIEESHAQNEKARQTRLQDEAKIVPQELIIDSGYLLCLKNEDLSYLTKVKLTAIKKIVTDSSNDHICYFYTSSREDVKYMTWVSGDILSCMIDEWIQTVSHYSIYYKT